jgi:hypothetical protein
MNELQTFSLIRSGPVCLGSRLTPMAGCERATGSVDTGKMTFQKA